MIVSASFTKWRLDLELGDAILEKPAIESIYGHIRGTRKRDGSVYNKDRKDLFDYSHWVFPINENSVHWVVAIVSFPNPRHPDWKENLQFIYIDPNSFTSGGKPPGCVDPTAYGTVKERLKDRMLEFYLTFWGYERVDRNISCSDLMSEVTQEKFHHLVDYGYRQCNLYDCGMYTVHYIQDYIVACSSKSKEVSFSFLRHKKKPYDHVFVEPASTKLDSVYFELKEMLHEIVSKPYVFDAYDRPRQGDHIEHKGYAYRTKTTCDTS